MKRILNSGPNVEAVSTQEMKNHLRIEHDDEDILIAGLITAARAHIEIKTEHIMIRQNWSLFLDQWPTNKPYITIPLRPVTQITNIFVHQSKTKKQNIAPDNITLDALADPARVIVQKNAQYHIMRSVNGIEIQFNAGFGQTPQTIPKNLKLAVMQLAAHWYENREAVAMTGKPAQMPLATHMLIKPYIRKKII